MPTKNLGIKCFVCGWMLELVIGWVLVTVVFIKNALLIGAK